MDPAAPPAMLVAVVAVVALPVIPIPHVPLAPEPVVDGAPTVAYEIVTAVPPLNVAPGEAPPEEAIVNDWIHLF